MSCVSGQELINKGYRADVEIAAEVHLSDAVPLLQGQRFVRVSLP
jgi:phosphosulfolactate phosphohydrolase-like enzyme